MSEDSQETSQKSSGKFLEEKDEYPERFWQEMDVIEEEMCLSSDSEKKKKKPIFPRRITNKKPDVGKRIAQIRAYEEALRKHRQTTWTYIDPFTFNIALNISPQESIELESNMANGIRNDQMMAQALRKIGMKRMKIVFKCNAADYFQIVIHYLNCRRLPEWMKIKFDDLLKNKI